MLNQLAADELGVSGQPRERGGIRGRFDRNNIPKKGDTIAYYDGEGGVSKTEMVGQVLDVSPGSNRPILVRSRTGNPIWIDPESGRPHTVTR